MKKIVVGVFVSLILSFNAFGQTSQFKATFIKAQQENRQVTVTLSNGNTYVGSVVSVDEESAGVQTKDGVFNFRYERIESVKIYNPDDKSSGWRDNPAKNKLFISQSGKMLDSGSGYYQNTYIFLSNFSYGLTKNISIDAGFSMIPGLGIDNQLFTVGAKVGTSFNNTLSISGNIKYYKVFDVDQGITSVFGSATYSKKQLDLTGGAGIGFADNSSSDPIFIIGGQYRVSERFAFLTENIILPAGDSGSEALISFGGRILNSKSAFDLGFFTVDGDAYVPFISYTVKF
ncbi:MAG: hypothetical protein ABJR05_09205 [Balneola sp.]